MNQALAPVKTTPTQSTFLGSVCKSFVRLGHNESEESFPTTQRRFYRTGIEPGPATFRSLTRRSTTELSQPTFSYHQLITNDRKIVHSVAFGFSLTQEFACMSHFAKDGFSIFQRVKKHRIISIAEMSHRWR